jgi:hypothetical protein
MEVKELKIDNWIKYNFKMQGWNDVQVCANDFHNGFRDDKFVSINYKPIPLTEEWLLKFGFEKEMDGSLVLNNLAIFLDKRFKENVYLMTIEGGIFGSEVWNKLHNLKLKHVHQLQNLYFALTNEELTIK